MAKLLVAENEHAQLQCTVNHYDSFHFISKRSINTPDLQLPNVCLLYLYHAHTCSFLLAFGSFLLFLCLLLRLGILKRFGSPHLDGLLDAGMVCNATAVHL